MRAILTAVLGSALLATAAAAADMPIKAGYAPVAPGPMWSGFYAGLNAGYGWGSVSGTNTSTDLDGFIGGGQIGYNWQRGALVFGLEADIQGSAQSHTTNVTILATPFAIEQEIPWFATARARLGFANGPWLFYVTGGAAWGSYKMKVSTGGTSVSDNDTKLAGTVGAGVEWMIAPRWSTKVEYLYVDTGNTTVTLGGVTFDGRLKDNIVRAGVNYHF